MPIMQYIRTYVIRLSFLARLKHKLLTIYLSVIAIPKQVLLGQMDWQKKG